ncbi:cytochrome c [Undibacterium sp. RuRC25W]|uniref:cytochrome c n=1 Tax=Undibacterium sp. RuRC25W TaxID=3413047 RepID=UPI003BF062A4
MKRIIQVFILVVGMLLVLTAWYVIKVGYLVSDERETVQSVKSQTETTMSKVRRGEYLTQVANCSGCHTNTGGALYAGGKVVQSEFGNFVVPNITPDSRTGIGRWSVNDFWQALHFGKLPDGRLLYPAFPYTNYALISREDAEAMFAYLKSLPAINQPSAPHQLRFPYNQRPLLAIWRALYFRPQTYQSDLSRSVDWNRGAYLVNGLGHCSACHSSRNMLGANAGSEYLNGGEMPIVAWYAPSLSRVDEAHQARFSQAQSLKLFTSGLADNAAFYGPMAEVFANSLQYYSEADIAAMNVYLRELPAIKKQTPYSMENPPDAAVSTPEAITQRMVQGAALYKTHCSLCHGAAGEGVAAIYPALAKNNALQMSSVVNPIRIVLNGGFPPTSLSNPRPYGMPPFGPVLSDNEVALVLTYVRNSWGNHGSHIGAVTVNRYRNAPINE